MTQTLAICIGAQKAGTTWLADQLRRHPEVHSPPVKEVHYFDARFVPKWCAKYEAEMLAEFQREVAALTTDTCGDPLLNQKLGAMLLRFRMIIEPRDYLRFMTWGAGGRRVLFEATPDYSMLPEKGFSAMRSVHPDVRLVFLLRNPADRYWSSMQFNKTLNPEFDIEGAFGRCLLREDFVLFADYGRTIRAASAVFPRERIHTEFYERLFAGEAIERLCGFLGIAPFNADFATRSNASGDVPMPADRRRAATLAYARVYREMDALFGGDLPPSWRADLGVIRAG